MAIRESTSLVLLLSDLHVGKQTASYSTEVAVERIKSIPDKLIDHPGLPRFGELVVLLLGDIVDGEDIYAGHNATLREGALDQHLAATDALWRMLLHLRRRMRNGATVRPLRVHTVPGNHGRMSHSASGRSNWDNAVYSRLADRAAHHSAEGHLSVEAGLEPFLRVEVQGQGVLMQHAGVKHLGTPAMQTRCARWLRRHDARYLVHGHWHHAEMTPIDDCYRIATGSMCGVDSLAEQMACYDPPRQTFFAVGVVAYSWLEW
jgi:calcineurin-like phosphoesterase family protein